VKTRRSLYPSIRKALLVAALPLLLVACSGNGGNRADQAATLPEPSIEAVPVPISGFTAFKQSPIAAFHLTVDQSVSLWTATRSRSISCVRDKGFTEYNGELIDKGTPPDGSADAITQLAGPWGYLGDRTATEQGFAPGPIVVAESDPDIDLPADVRAASQTCFDEASKEFSAPVTGVDLVRQLVTEAEGHTARDSRVVAARSQWVRCMATAGFANADPVELATRQWRQKPTDQPAPGEVTTAKADQECTASSGLAKAYFPVNWAYQRELIDLNSPSLKEYQAAIRTLLAKVTQTGAKTE
jgi:hypothetical protein